LWVLEHFDVGPLYSVPIPLRISGHLDEQVLERALNAVIARHEALRAIIAADSDGRPVQTFAANATVTVGRVDQRDLCEFDRHAQMTQEACRKFDLAQGGLLRAKLFRLQDDEWILLLTVHHIIFDEWSRQVFAEEVLVNYDAFLQGLVSPLPPVAFQYSGFAEWQRRFLEGASCAKQLGYWTRVLEGVGDSQLPPDSARAPVPHWEGAELHDVLSSDVVERLTELGRRESTTLFIVLLTALSLLVRDLIGHDDVIVGVPSANRARPETHGIVGLVLNTLALRLRLAPNATFRDVMGEVTAVTLEAQRNQDVPFEHVVRKIRGPAARRGHSPLFQILFAMRQWPRFSGVGALQVEALPYVFTGTAKAELSVFAAEVAGGMRLTFEYRVDVFRVDTIRRWMGDYVQILKDALSSVERPIGRRPA
jgi:hypothetical protein